MKMAELEDRTGVDREVIRILLRKGLIPEPERPARNAAVYDERHVRAIAVVRELQHGSRLTLDEIKAAMDGDGLDERGGAETYQHLEELLAIRFGVDQTPSVTVDTLAERYPKARRDAQALAGLGMLELIGEKGGERLSLTDARLVEIWGRIREAGFIDEIGFPPENIAFYLEAAELVASKEVEVFLKGSGGRIDEERAAAMLQAALPLMLDFFGLLRIKAFLRIMHGMVEDGGRG
jgi:DNA-binding transcriptional MerR regulator